MAKRTCILMLAALCAAVFVSYGQVRTVKVVGPSIERSAALSHVLSPFSSFPSDSLSAKALEWLTSEGYLRASCDSIHVGGTETTVWLREGKIARLDSVVLNGPPRPIIAMLGEAGGIGPGQVFTREAVEAGIHLLLSRLEDQGYLSASVRVEDLSEVEHEASWGYSLTLAVETGAKAVVGEVRSRGNEATRSETVVRLSGIRIGETWTRRTNDQGRRRLVRSGLFRDVSEPLVVVNETPGAIVTLTVVEGRHNTVDAIAGYLPAQGSTSGILTGLVHLQFRNLFGTARRLGLRWFQERQGTQDIEASYAEPWVLGGPVGAEGKFGQRKEDSSFIRQRLSLNASGELWNDLTAAISIHRSTTIPLESVSGRRLIGSTQTLIGISATFDTRDDPVTPGRGMLYHTDVQSGRKASGGTSASASRSRFDAAGYIPLGRTQTGVLEGHWMDVRGTTIDDADLFRFGGATTLRGYREGEFLLSRALWGTVEVRYLLDVRSYVSAFVDAALMDHPSLPPTGQMSVALDRIGYGLSMRIDAPVGLIAISFAWGKGDGVGDAKLHLRVQNEF